MASASYISDQDESNKIYFDVDPEPISTPKKDRRVVIRQLFSGKSGSNYIAGQSKVTDLGASRYGSRINITIPYFSDTNLDNLLTKYADPTTNKINIVKFYDSHGNKKYTCIFEGGDSLDYKRVLGIGSVWYNINISLIIIDSEDMSVVADEKVKVSSNDTTANYLVLKLVAGQSIVLTEVGDPGNETLQIAVQNATTGQKGVVQYGTTANTACQGNDSRLPSNTVISTSVNYTVLVSNGNEHKVKVDCTSGNIQVNLPAAAGWTGMTFHITKIDSSANNVIVVPNGAETIIGAASLSFNSQYQVVSAWSDGSNVFIR